jgi:hypothetical protein
MEDITFPVIIDNTIPGERFGDYMKHFLAKCTRGIWCSGYFYVSAFKALHVPLDRIASLRVIIGMETNYFTAGMVEDAQIEKLWRKIAEELSGDLDAYDFEGGGDFYDALHAKLLDGTIEVRVPRTPSHDKVYWMDQVDDVRNVVIRGSGNFSITAFGYTVPLQTNNMEIDANNDRTGYYKAMLEKAWEGAVPFTRRLVKVMEDHPGARGHRERKARQPVADPDGLVHVPPPEFFKHVIAARRDFHLFDAGKVVLKSYQQADYLNCREIIQKCGGVLLADDAGLGKTFVGCRLLQDYYHDDKKFLVVSPPGRSHDQWLDHVEHKFGMSLANGSKVISDGILQTGTFSAMDWRGFAVALIDESQNFRNDETKRFKAFMSSFKAVNPDADIVLVSATPMMNDVDDLVAQIRIIENPGKFRIAVGKDFDAFKVMAQKVDAFRRSKAEIPGDLDEQMRDLGSRVQRKLVVRTTQREMRESGETFDINGAPANFQEVVPEQIVYSLSGLVYAGIFTNLFPGLLGVLRFPHAGLLSAVIDIDDDEDEGAMATGFQITGLYKRFESSIHSFATSLKNLRDREGKLAAMLENPSFDARVMQARRMAEKITSMQGETGEKERDKRDVLQAQLAALKRGIQNDWITAVPAGAQAIKRLAGTVSRSRDIDGERVVDILLAILDDVNAILSFEQRIDQLRDPADRMSMHDDKADALVSLLKQHPGDKVLIFTQFKDTAEYIEHALRRDDIGPIVSVHGQMRANDKEDAMTAFCPKYAPVDVVARVKKRHGGNIPRSIRIMVATDSMSQSVNLQEARRVINYDLPWNPMTMYQRNGRARRVDNPNPVDAYNFVPDAQIDEALGLIDLLKGKIDIIAKVIGLSTKLLSKDDDHGDDPAAIKEAFKDRLARIRASAGWAIDVERAETDEVSAFLRAVVAARGWRREDARELPRVGGKIPYTIAKGPPGTAVAFCTVSVEKTGGTRDRLHHATIFVDVASGTPATPGAFRPPPSIDTVPRPLAAGEIAAIKGIVESGAASIASSAAMSLRETKQSASARVQAHREKNKLVTLLKRGSLFSKTITRETQDDKEIKAKARKAVLALQRKELATNDLLTDIRAFSTKWLPDTRALAGDVLKTFYADIDDIATRAKDAGESIAGKKIVATIDGIAVFRG